MVWRETSAMVTLSRTWSRPRMVSELMTAPVVAVPPPAPPPETPTKARAMSMACVASEAFATLPMSRIESPAGFTSISARGSAVRSVWRSTLRSLPTAMSSVAICWPSASIAKMEVAPSATPMMNSLRAERTTALATFGLATKTSLASRGSSMMIDLPMDRSIRWPVPAAPRVLMRWLEEAFCASAALMANWAGMATAAAMAASRIMRELGSRLLRVMFDLTASRTGK